jgi:hypothetical protein
VFELVAAVHEMEMLFAVLELTVMVLSLTVGAAACALKLATPSIAITKTRDVARRVSTRGCNRVATVCVKIFLILFTIKIYNCYLL